MEFDCRKAGLEDAPLIQNLASRVFGPTYKDILSPNQLDYMFDMMYSLPSLHEQMTTLGHQYYIAYKEDKPCGYISVERKKENLFHLQKIYILPSFQGTGLGRFLMEKAFEHVRSASHGIPCTLELNVNRYNKALDFYLHMGFKIARSGDFPIGNGYFMNDYIMSLDIN